MIPADLAPLAVVLPFLGAAITFILIRHAHAQRAVSISILSVTLLTEIVMLLNAPATGTYAVRLGGWDAPFGIVLVVDQFSALMLVISSAVSPRC